ncbi:mechanosensitive ion channel family protein [Microbacterium sp. C7(2022)]|uniref:mechanosensitive ion channel family protein n=1 Tax=Microbacterium sp. C7(2022) TaxID=2992759 RepID=UPI00237C10E6|nr:mechanosensitive ion channel domain-containing protein [Microbacterium sp. C7(2022)]MDE0546954.1 mechanosensitive ion channel family protein [Microbacterium sp. C7(2022)]
MLRTSAPDVTDPVLWTQVGDFFIDAGWSLIKVTAVVVVAVLVSWICRLIIRRVVDRIVSGAKSKARVEDTQALERSPLASVRLVQRTRTLGSILSNIVNVAIVIIAALLIVTILAPTALGSLTLLTAAIGAGLGFGAQNIVKDVLNGIFIVAEDQIGIGDVVDVGLASGIVEYVSVRVTHVRDVNGTLWYVRNGEITRIGNLSQGWSRVIIDLALPLDADTVAAEGALLDAANELARDPKWRTRIIEQPEIWGLESITGDAIIVRLVMKTRANAKDDVAAELRRRLKSAADAAGLSLPGMASVIPTGIDGAQRVRGANPPKTKPQPIAVAPAARPVWKPKRGTETPAAPEPDEGAGPSGNAEKEK